MYNKWDEETRPGLCVFKANSSNKKKKIRHMFCGASDIWTLDAIYNRELDQIATTITIQ